MNDTDKRHQFDTVVIGSGQAGLAAGYYLALQGQDFVILDAHPRIGTSWRERWDSLRLFTPAYISSLPGMSLSVPANTFLSKDEVANYLEAYAAHFHLPIRLNATVKTLSRLNGRYLLAVNDELLEAERVAIATGACQQPRIPSFASELDPTIVQFHSDDYRNHNQLQPGAVLLVGAGNSGAEIALELAPTRQVWLAGRDPGHRPKNVPPLFRSLYWWLLHQAINTNNKIGRRVKEQAESAGAPLIGIAKDAFERAGVERTPRMVGVQEGKPQLQDGRVLSVTNVIWCTGFVPDFHWIDLPGFENAGYPVHTRGVVEGEPGLYLLGQPFQYTLTSSFIGGVGRDAKYIVEHIVAHPSARELPLKTAVKV
ncbi:MAG: NAD(P)-binding domain-containing protein [Ktedonobacteraceae bacterium]|nr:NAD(P)-binding domain-containing protein [Ktedonobacteraceae bacterium]